MKSDLCIHDWRNISELDNDMPTYECMICGKQKIGNGYPKADINGIKEWIKESNNDEKRKIEKIIWFENRKKEMGE